MAAPLIVPIRPIGTGFKDGTGGQARFNRLTPKKLLIYCLLMVRVSADSIRKIFAGVDEERVSAIVGEGMSFAELMDDIRLDDCDAVEIAVRLMTDRQQAYFAALCSRTVLHVFERGYPDDRRPRDAISALKKYGRGEISREEYGKIQLSAMTIWNDDEKADQVVLAAVCDGGMAWAAWEAAAVCNDDGKKAAWARYRRYAARVLNGGAPRDRT